MYLYYIIKFYDNVYYNIACMIDDISLCDIPKCAFNQKEIIVAGSSQNIFLGQTDLQIRSMLHEGVTDQDT